MGIPIIQEIFDGIRWLIDFFFNKTPRVIQIMIFLLLILVVGNIVNFVLQLGGLHCNSHKEPMKISLIDISTNYDLLQRSNKVFTAENYTLCEVNDALCGNEHDAYFFAYKLGDGYYTECNLTNPEPNCTYLYKDGVCFDCNEQEICFKEAQFLWFCGNWYSVCLGDAYPADPDVTDVVTRCSDKYEIPEHYKFSSTTGLYECVDDYCGSNATHVPLASIDEILDRKGAELVYVNESDQMIDFVKLSCNNNYKIRLTFFGIDIFSYKYWVIILLIYSMFIFLSLIQRH